MKKLLLRTIGVLATLLMASGGWGATVETISCPVNSSLTCATRITDLVVDGVTYNVDFVRDSFDNLNSGSNFPFVNDATNGAAARDAITLALNGTSATRIDYGDVDINDFFVPYQVNASVWSYTGYCVSDDCWGEDSGPVDPANNKIRYATFSVVPIPASAWLFGSALLGLGAIKRKKVA